MNVLDKLQAKSEKNPDALTTIEKLILSPNVPQETKLLAAAEWHELHERLAGREKTFSDPKDMTALLGQL